MNEQTKFTKGPWQINDRNGYQVCDADGEHRGCSPIATMRGTNAEKRANANLIAAAPELYEALERVTDQLAHEYPNDEAWVAARAALAKARGETP